MKHAAERKPAFNIFRKKVASKTARQPLAELQPLLLTIPEAARYLNSTIWLVRTLIWTRQLRAIKLGRRYLIAPEDLEAYKNRMLAEAGPSGTVPSHGPKFRKTVAEVK